MKEFYFFYFSRGYRALNKRNTQHTQLSRQAFGFDYFIFRMLSITQDEINIKDRELKECRLQNAEIDNLLNERQWQLKEKAAQVYIYLFVCLQQCVKFHIPYSKYTKLMNSVVL